MVETILSNEIMCNEIMCIGFVMHYDCGHAWLKASKRDIKFIGCADKITAYSYMDKDNVYLEEDLDAGTFIEAYKKKCKACGISKVEITIDSIDDGDDSPIRKLQHYNKEAL